MTKYLAALVIALVLNASANLMIRFGMRAIDLELGGAGMLDGGVWGLAKLLLRHPVVLAKAAATLHLLGFLPYLIWVGNLVFCIIAGMAANRGEAYRYPFALRLVT